MVAEGQSHVFGVEAQQEEHVVLIVILNKMHHFQCYVWILIVWLVWLGRNLISEKVEKLESWMARLIFRSMSNVPSVFFFFLGTTPDNPAFITSNQITGYGYKCFTCFTCFYYL